MKEPADKFPLPKVCCFQIPEQNLVRVREAVLGFIGTEHLPKFSPVVQAVSETHKAWPENVLFNGIDLGGSELFHLIVLSLFPWTFSFLL